jgi:hypothetical protein
MTADDPTPGGTPDAPAPDPSTVDTLESPPEPGSGGEGLWDAYWERFRRQQVDDPVEERREGLWDRFKRQQVDDPVDERRSRRSS